LQSPEIDKTWQTLALLSGHAQRDKSFQFTSLAHLLNEEFLRDCYKGVHKDRATGIDGVSWQEYGINLTENLKDVHRRLKNQGFKPLPVKRVYIAKNEKEKRPLGLPSLESKIVERGLCWILESIYEEDFLDCSFGFRPRRNCHQALKRLNDTITIQPVSYIIEADIKGFFDNVPHDKLMEFVKIRVRDTVVLNLIERYLKAGVMEDRMLTISDTGVPQGGILSPLLANIYLHYVLDCWFWQAVKPNVKGYCELIRYADDFVIAVRNKDDAVRIERGLHNRFNKYGLELHKEKSRTLSFGRFEKESALREKRKANTFNFLGFTHFCDKTRNGRFKIGRKTSRKKFIAKCKEMNEWLKKVRNEVETKEWWKTLKQKLSGHYQYFGVSENIKGITRYYKTTIFLTRKWLNRRSQRGAMSWEKFYNYIKLYALPKPRITHSFYGNLGLRR
jgi:RNA-directed DNA polymerase